MVSESRLIFLPAGEDHFYGDHNQKFALSSYLNVNGFIRPKGALGTAATKVEQWLRNKVNPSQPRTSLWDPTAQLLKPFQFTKLPTLKVHLRDETLKGKEGEKPLGITTLTVGDPYYFLRHRGEAVSISKEVKRVRASYGGFENVFWSATGFSLSAKKSSQEVHDLELLAAAFAGKIDLSIHRTHYSAAPGERETLVIPGYEKPGLVLAPGPLTKLPEELVAGALKAQDYSFQQWRLENRPEVRRYVDAFARIFPDKHLHPFPKWEHPGFIDGKGSLRDFGYNVNGVTRHMLSDGRPFQGRFIEEEISSILEAALTEPSTPRRSRPVKKVFIDSLYETEGRYGVA